MKKKHLRELKRITDSIPKELLKKLTKKQLMFPAAKEIAERAQTDPKVSPKDKRKLRAMLDSGYLDKMEEVVDPEVEKQISDYVEAEIEKAKKLGRLPEIPPKLILRKSKQNARKQASEMVSESIPSEAAIEEGDHQGRDQKDA